MHQSVMIDFMKGYDSNFQLRVYVVYIHCSCIYVKKVQFIYKKILSDCQDVILVRDMKLQRSLLCYYKISNITTPLTMCNGEYIIIIIIIIINEKISVVFSPKTARTRNTHTKSRHVR